MMAGVTLCLWSLLFLGWTFVGSDAQSDGLVKCGNRRVNPSTTLCCHGTIYIKKGIRPSCCWSLAYDAQYHMCCRNTVQRKVGVMPRCCGDRSYNGIDKVCVDGRVKPRHDDVGTVCCNTDKGVKCCKRQENCCAFLGSGSLDRMDFVGFRPICCELHNPREKSRCCRDTLSKTGALPSCCDGARGPAEGIGMVDGTGGHRPGGTDYRPGGTDYRPGGTDYRPGGTDYRPGGTDYRPGGHFPGGTDYRPGRNGFNGVGVTVSPSLPTRGSCCHFSHPQKWCCPSFVPTDAPVTAPPVDGGIAGGPGDHKCCRSSGPQPQCCISPFPVPQCCVNIVRVSCCAIVDMNALLSCCNGHGPRPRCCGGTRGGNGFSSATQDATNRRGYQSHGAGAGTYTDHQTGSRTHGTRHQTSGATYGRHQNNVGSYDTYRHPDTDQQGGHQAYSHSSSDHQSQHETQHQISYGAENYNYGTGAQGAKREHEEPPRRDTYGADTDTGYHVAGRSRQVHEEVDTGYQVDPEYGVPRVREETHPVNVVPQYERENLEEDRYGVGHTGDRVHQPDAEQGQPDYSRYFQTGDTHQESQTGTEHNLPPREYSTSYRVHNAPHETYPDSTGHGFQPPKAYNGDALEDLLSYGKAPVYQPETDEYVPLAFEISPPTETELEVYDDGGHKVETHYENLRPVPIDLRHTKQDNTANVPATHEKPVPEGGDAHTLYGSENSYTQNNYGREISSPIRAGFEHVNAANRHRQTTGQTHHSYVIIANDTQEVHKKVPDSHKGATAILSCCAISTEKRTECCLSGVALAGIFPDCCASSTLIEPVHDQPHASQPQAPQPQAIEQHADIPHGDQPQGDQPQADVAADFLSEGLVTVNQNGRRGRKENFKQWHHQKHNGRVCSGQRYRKRTHLCCDGTIREKHGRRPACCGKYAFDKSIYRCCNGVVRRRCN